MYNFSDECVHFGRRDCSTSAAGGVQLERYIQAEMYREYLRSGKTIKEWCEENGIARTTFHNRLRRIREAALEPKHKIVPVNADAGSMNIPTVTAEGVIRITGCGITTELPQDISPELSEALQEGRLSMLEKCLRKFDLLIIDELSYLTFNRSQSELLFQVISERSEKASVIITTNLEFSQWTQLFENEMMVAALVDRVTFNSQILNMNCTTSYRMETALNGQPAPRT